MNVPSALLEELTPLLRQTKETGEQILCLNGSSLIGASEELQQHITDLLRKVYNGPYLDHFGHGADYYSFNHMFDGVLKPLSNAGSDGPIRLAGPSKAGI